MLCIASLPSHSACLRPRFFTREEPPSARKPSHTMCAQAANPFVFKHVQHVTNARALEGVGASVVMATPSMLQSGLSRELFEAWCAHMCSCGLSGLSHSLPPAQQALRKSI